MKVRSRIGVIWIIGIVILLVCNVFYLQTMIAQINIITIVGGVLFLIIDVIFFWMTFDTWYAFHEDELEIHCACFVSQRIPYKNICNIKECWNAFSSLGMSMHRIQITFPAPNGNGEDEVFISPVNQEKFIETLKVCKCKGYQV